MTSTTLPTRAICAATRDFSESLNEIFSELARFAQAQFQEDNTLEYGLPFACVDTADSNHTAHLGIALGRTPEDARLATDAYKLVRISLPNNEIEGKLANSNSLIHRSMNRPEMETALAKAAYHLPILNFQDHEMKVVGA